MLLFHLKEWLGKESERRKNIFRYRPPIPVITNPTIVSQDKLNLIVQNNSIFSFLIQRERNGVNIWDTSIGGLLFADQYLQIAAKLATNKIYGFGENIHQHLQVNFKFEKNFKNSNFSII